MKIAIVGSRAITELDLTPYLPPNPDLVISGGAQGVDRLAEAWARQRGIPVQIFLPDYQRFGRGAPLVRNRLIVGASDLVVAFWDGRSRGTRFTIDEALRAGVDLRVYNFPGGTGRK